MINLRKAAGFCTIASILMSAGLVAILVMPRLKARALGPGSSATDAGMAAAHVLALKEEVARLQKLLVAAQATCAPGGSQTAGSAAGSLQTALLRSSVQRTLGKANEVVIDLHHLLGSRSYFEGISFDTYRCAPPLDRVFRGLTDDQFQTVWDSFVDQLATAMAAVLGKERVERSTSWKEELMLPAQSEAEAMDAVVSDPRTAVWREQVTLVMSRFMMFENRTSFLSCPEAPQSILMEDVGKNPCPSLSSDAIIQQMGFHALPYIHILNLSHDALKWGLCTKPPAMAGSFGQWLKEKRMFSEESKTFAVSTLEEDAVVFLFDVLYEKRNVFKQQYWLGTIMMQNPFDMYSITDIIYTVRPDLIIETGTANGGSALLWASVMYLNNIPDGRVLTLDVAEPAWDPNVTHWGGTPRSDATKHPLWKEHVRFIKGSSTSLDVYAQVKKAAEGAGSVLVLLDSHHTDEHARAEAALYCPLVTVNSYCIIQDTKLSRFALDGPLEAARAYVKQYPNDFEADRGRELLFTHHAMGYLKRIAIQDVRPRESPTDSNSQWSWQR